MNESIDLNKSIESLNDGAGGSFWVFHLRSRIADEPPVGLDRAVWFSSAGNIQFTNDFIISDGGADGPERRPTKVVRVTRTDVLLQKTVLSDAPDEDGIHDYNDYTNTIVRIKKGKTGGVQTSVSLATEESVGLLYQPNAVSDARGFFTRQVIRNEDGDVVRVVLRRHVN